MNHLDAVAGSQIAMMTTLKLLLTPYKGNEQAVNALLSELERTRAGLLASSSSDEKIQAFDQASEGLMKVIDE